MALSLSPQLAEEIYSSPVTKVVQPTQNYTSSTQAAYKPQGDPSPNLSMSQIQTALQGATTPGQINQAAGNTTVPTPAVITKKNPITGQQFPITTPPTVPQVTLPPPPTAPTAPATGAAAPGGGGEVPSYGYNPNDVNRAQESEVGSIQDIPFLVDDEILLNLSAEEIDAMMSAIEAQYGLTREQLLSDKSQIGLQFQRLALQLDSARARDLQSAENAALERGIGRSGILNKSLGDVETQYATQIQNEALAGQQQITDINTALARLQEQQMLEQARVRSQAEIGVNQFQQQELLNNLMTTLPLQPIQPPGPVLPNPPVLQNPQIPGAPTLEQILAALGQGTPGGGLPPAVV